MLTLCQCLNSFPLPTTCSSRPPSPSTLPCPSPLASLFDCQPHLDLQLLHRIALLLSDNCGPLLLWSSAEALCIGRSEAVELSLSLATLSNRWDSVFSSDGWWGMLAFLGGDRVGSICESDGVV